MIYTYKTKNSCKIYLPSIKLHALLPLQHTPKLKQTQNFVFDFRQGEEEQASRSTERLTLYAGLPSKDGTSASTPCTPPDIVTAEDFHKRKATHTRKVMLVKRKQTKQTTTTTAKKTKPSTSTTWEKSAPSRVSGEFSFLIHWRDTHTQTQEFKATTHILLAKRGCFLQGS